MFTFWKYIKIMYTIFLPRIIIFVMEFISSGFQKPKLTYLHTIQYPDP